MQQEIKVTIEGPVGSGKSGIAFLLENALMAHGVNVNWVGGREEKNQRNESEIHDMLLATAPRVKIFEMGQTKRDLTLEERMTAIQTRLTDRGMRDIKITLAEPNKPRTLQEFQEGVVEFMEAYLEGRYSPPVTLEINPGSEPN